MRPGQIMCVCGEAHWPKLAWKHKDCATNVATNKVSTHATNTKSVATNANSDTPTLAAVDPVVVGASVDVRDRTANRRKREDYNAYQRELMRKRRSNQKEAKPA